MIVINKSHVYNFIFLIFFFFSLIIPISISSNFYDYINILDKGPKSDMTYIFSEKPPKSKKDSKENKESDEYMKLVDETYKSYQSLFFTDLQTITPLYDQSIKCYFPLKKELSFNDDLYINHNFFHNTTKIKIIPEKLARILLKPLLNICYNHFIDKWYYKLCPFNKAVQTLTYLKTNPKTKKEEKEVNYLGYASNDTNDFNELNYFYEESPIKKEFFEKEIYNFLDKTKIVGIYKNVIKIYDSIDEQNEFKKISEENKTNEILQDYLIYKYQYKKLEIDYDRSVLKKAKAIEGVNLMKLYEYKIKNNSNSNIITYEREIKRAINKNVFLLNDDLPPLFEGIINTRIEVFPYNAEDYYNKEFFVEKNLLYCEHCNLLKCQSNNCYLTLSKNKEQYYKVIDFIDEKLVVLDSNIEKEISHYSKFALFINDEFIFFFGKGKIKEIKRIQEKLDDDEEDNKSIYKYILKGTNLNLQEGDNILIPFKNIQKGEYIIIKDKNNSKLYLDCVINRVINEEDYEIIINNLKNSSFSDSIIIPVGEKYFKIEERNKIQKNEQNIQVINKSKNIIFNTNVDKNLFNIDQLSQISVSRGNLNIDVPYEIFNPKNKNNQTIFHFVLKKISPWKESYINICLSPNESCTENDIEIIIHSKKGILIHNPKTSSEKIINDSLLFYSNDVINLFTEKIICDLIFINSTLYFNVMDYSENSFVKIKYSFKKEEYEKIKYAIIATSKSMNVKIKNIYVTNIISKILYMNIYFYDKLYLLDDKAVFMETYTNGDYCPVIRGPRTVKVFYMCDETGISNLKINKVYEAKNRLCEYKYFVKSRFLCNPNNIMRTQFNISYSKSLCYSDKKFK